MDVVLTERLPPAELPELRAAADTQLDDDGAASEGQDLGKRRHDLPWGKKVPFSLCASVAFGFTLHALPGGLAAAMTQEKKEKKEKMKRTRERDMAFDSDDGDQRQRRSRHKHKHARAGSHIRFT